MRAVLAGFAVSGGLIALCVYGRRWVIDRLDGFFERWEAHSKVNPWL